MANTTVRRPLPALLSLLGLLLLTGIVWWRVASRDDGTGASANCPSPSGSPPSASASALPAPRTVSVQVVNSTKHAGLAAKVTTDLQHLGFQTSTPANDPITTPNAASAQIRFGPAGRRAATLLHYYVPGSTLVTTTSKTATVVVAVGEAYKSLATQAAVDAALKGDKLTVASAAASPAATSSAAC